MGLASNGPRTGGARTMAIDTCRDQPIIAAMSIKSQLRVALPLVTAVAFVGCVRPARMDPTLLHQYQRYLVDTGLVRPPVFGGRRPVQLARPTGEPPLKTVKDPRTGQTGIELTLQAAVRRTLRNNPAIKVIMYDPAIAREDVRQSEAAFDATILATLALDRIDSQTGTTGPGTLTSSQTGQLHLPSAPSSVTTDSKSIPLEVGVRKPLTTGGEIELAHGITRRDANTGSINPSYHQSLALTLTQPLLRNAGPDFALARIRVARMNQDLSIQAFRAAVMDEIVAVQTLYWQLVRARQELEIQQRLLERTEKTYEQVVARSEIDANKVEISQTAAQVAASKAALLRAHKNILDIEDQLVSKMGDPSITLTDEDVIIPVTAPLTAELIVDAADQAAAALTYSPELAQARTAIKIDNVRVQVARNQTRPRLDLQASTAITGLDNNWGGAWNEAWGGDYINYNLALTFEWPIGNRGARAALRSARHGRDKSIATLQNAVDQITLAVREAVRQINTTYRERSANQVTLKASEENLQALIDRQRYLEALSPSFLDLQLRAQENVAAAERSVLQATVDYNIAQAGLARAAGTCLVAAGVTISDAGEDFVNLLAEQVKLTGTEAPSPATAPATKPAR